MPSTLDEIEARLLKPLKDILPEPPKFPQGAVSAHPFSGGETAALNRVRNLIMSGAMASYKQTRNGLVGPEFSTKLSGFLAHGCLTARHVHAELEKYEDGNGEETTYKGAPGYGEGENEGTKAVRFELLWRDYMRLCTRKFRHRLFRLTGFRDVCNAQYVNKWKSPSQAARPPSQIESPAKIAEIIQRFNEGSTGMGLIDASQRELFHTGYTSNRTRQNVASFLAKHLGHRLAVRGRVVRNDASRLRRVVKLVQLAVRLGGGQRSPR